VFFRRGKRRKRTFEATTAVPPGRLLMSERTSEKTDSMYGWGSFRSERRKKRKEKKKKKRKSKEKNSINPKKTRATIEKNAPACGTSSSRMAARSSVAMIPWSLVTRITVRMLLRITRSPIITNASRAEIAATLISWNHKQATAKKNVNQSKT